MCGEGAGGGGRVEREGGERGGREGGGRRGRGEGEGEISPSVQSSPSGVNKTSSSRHHLWLWANTPQSILKADLRVEESIILRDKPGRWGSAANFSTWACIPKEWLMTQDRSDAMSGPNTWLFGALFGSKRRYFPCIFGPQICHHIIPKISNANETRFSWKIVADIGTWSLYGLLPTW